jgi:hypothetical protein
MGVPTSVWDEVLAKLEISFVERQTRSAAEDTFNAD